MLVINSKSKEDRGDDKLQPFEGTSRDRDGRKKHLPTMFRVYRGPKDYFIAFRRDEPSKLQPANQCGIPEDGLTPEEFGTLETFAKESGKSILKSDWKPLQ